MVRDHGAFSHYRRRLRVDDSSIAIRTARPCDAVGIASVHVASWQEIYATLLPAEMLAKLSVPERTYRWTHLLEGFEQDGADRAFVAEVSDEIVGFISVGVQRSEGLRRDGFDAEITAVYVLERTQRRGIGQALLRRGAGHLLRHGLGAASLWVLEANTKARRFYERLGGRLVAEREEVRPETVLREVAYGWSQLAALSGGDYQGADASSHEARPAKRPQRS
jgi:ribosomal protein S18 acetylase RimI-like enzyme